MISIQKYNKQEGLKELSLKEITKWDSKSEENLWIDLWNENEETSNIILKDIFNFHPLSIEDCLKYVKQDVVHFPKIDNYEDYIFNNRFGWFILLRELLPRYDIPEGDKECSRH